MRDELGIILLKHISINRLSDDAPWHFGLRVRWALSPWTLIRLVVWYLEDSRELDRIGLTHSWCFLKREEIRWSFYFTRSIALQCLTVLPDIRMKRWRGTEMSDDLPLYHKDYATSRTSERVW